MSASWRVNIDTHGRWWALIVVSLGFLMSAINVSAMNVALPAIKLDLHFSGASLAWVVNAYLCTFGGFLLLCGRLGDVFGHRRIFLSGIMLYTLTSLGCGLATSSGMFVAARAAQGLAGAAISAATLSLIMKMFAEASKRARALGVCTFVSASAASLGLLVSGGLTEVLSWRWIFLVNVLVGTSVYALCFALLPRDKSSSIRGHLDIAGAVTVTTSLVITVFAIANAGQSGWSSPQTLGSLVLASTLLAAFVGIEGRAQSPLMPPGLFRIRSVAVSNTVGALWAAALLGWSFVSTQYLQLILKLSPLQVGYVFLPGALIAAVVSLGVSPMLIARFGTTRPLVSGLLIGGAGLAFLARTPVPANVMLDVLPGIVLVSLGSGMAYGPLMLSALSGVSSRDYGAASGVVNVSFALGGALGFSGLASLAAARTDDLLAAGASLSSALNGGYGAALSTSAIMATAAALISVFLVRRGVRPAA